MLSLLLQESWTKKLMFSLFSSKQARPGHQCLAGFNRLHETMPQFRKRMDKVVAFMNSERFKAPGGRGLEGLARSMRDRCQVVVESGGERVLK